MRMTLQELEFDNEAIHNMTMHHFLDKTYSLYISKITLSQSNFEQELKHFFKDILDKRV